MSSILQEGIVPDRQDDVHRPLTSKDHTDRPAHIQNLITGPRGVHWACGDVQSTEGHRNVSERATFTDEVERQETALGLTLDALLFYWVKPKQPIDVIAVLNVEGDLGGKGRETANGDRVENGPELSKMSRMISGPVPTSPAKGEPVENG